MMPFDGTSAKVIQLIVAIALTIFEILMFHTFDLEIKVTEYNIRNGSIRWQISTSIKVVIKHISLALTIFEIFIFLNL